MVAGLTVSTLTPTLLVGALVLLVAVAAVRLSTRSGLPSLLLYLALGLLLGTRGLGIQFDSAPLAQALGYAALVLILAEGGLTTRWSQIRRSVAPALVLSTVGVLVSVAVVGLAAHLVLGLDATTSLLIGAILSSTDAAAVFSVLRRVPIPHRLSGLLEAESGFNDAPVVILVTVFAEAAAHAGNHTGWPMLAVMAVVELAGGAAIGLAIGWVGGHLATRTAPGSSALFGLAMLALIVLAYATAAAAHASGFIACYLAALVLGNLELPHTTATQSFAASLGWLAHIGLFVMLGLLADPADFGPQVVPAVVLGAVLLLVARPLAVAVSLTPFRFRWRDQAFLSWAGLRGAVPVVLATVPITVGIPRLAWIYDLVFVLVVVFTALQAPVLPWVAGRLGVREESRALDLRVEATPLDDLHAGLLQVHVGPASRLAGVTVDELRLPPEAHVVLLVRQHTTVMPEPRTLIRHGDDLLIVTTAAVRNMVERRVRAVSLDGRLAGWSTEGRDGVRRDRE